MHAFDKLLLHIALADPPDDSATKDLTALINHASGWVMGILAAIATFFAIVAGVRRITAGGDPTEVEKSNEGFKSALKGYALAALAPLAMRILIEVLR